MKYTKITIELKTEFNNGLVILEEILDVLQENYNDIPLLKDSVEEVIESMVKVTAIQWVKTTHADGITIEENKRIKKDDKR